MIKKTILSIMAAWVAFGVYSQSKTDVAVNLLMKQVASGRSVSSAMRAKGVGDKSASLIVAVAPEALDELRAVADVKSYSNGVAIVDVPLANLQSLIDIEGMKYVKTPSHAQSFLNEARRSAGVDLVHAGQGLPQGYTGKGVTVGVADMGFDPGHIAFSDQEGSCRVRSFCYLDPDNTPHSVTDPEMISVILTDSRTDNHGTHVASIAAGRAMDNGYGGVAPDADIVMSSVTAKGVVTANDVAAVRMASDEVDLTATTNPFLLATAQAVEEMKALGQPCVLNMSIGSLAGPRDGKGLETQFIGGLAKDAIICMSSANQGEVLGALTILLQMKARRHTSLALAIGQCSTAALKFGPATTARSRLR